MEEEEYGDGITYIAHYKKWARFLHAPTNMAAYSTLHAQVPP